MGGAWNGNPSDEEWIDCHLDVCRDKGMNYEWCPLTDTKTYFKLLQLNINELFSYTQHGVHSYQTVVLEIYLENQVLFWKGRTDSPLLSFGIYEKKTEFLEYTKTF